MAEEASAAASANGLDIPIKTEPDDPFLEIEKSVIKQYASANGVHEDSDCEDVAYFSQVEVDNTRKCLENTRLIIKDFETQLDWHLQQYMTLRNVFNPKKNSRNGKDDNSKRQDLLSISQLSAIIANHPEGNKKFIKRKGPMSNGAARKRRRNKESDTEDSEFSEDDSEEYDEEDFDEGHDSEDVDDPGVAKKRKGRKKKEDGPEVKDEIEEEEHELIEPKVERCSEEKELTPAKKGRAPKKATGKVAVKRGPRGKKQVDTVDLTNLKTCKVVLSRIDDDANDSSVEVKDEDLDRDELAEMLNDKSIISLDKFVLDSEKPIVILKDDNVDNFDFTECETSNVIVAFEHKESLPEFVFVKDVANRILEGSIILVQAEVFDQHLSEDKI